MKINSKKILALLSSVVLSLNVLCGSICSAEETAPPSNDTVQAGTDISVQGTNSFGNMLGAVMENEQEEQIENNGYNVFSIEIADNVALVEYETVEESTLVVGIYDETGTRLIASGYTDVIPDEKQAYVEIETDTIPQYFYAKAYIINKETLRPMCSVFDCPMYTQQMQEFLAKTTEDFDADKVLNIDDSTDNNFAVYNDDTIIIKPQEGVNEVITANDTSNIYVIENPDETITSLTPGDVFAYQYSDTGLIIAKVASISISGNTATIIGADSNMEEVFSFVKIDSSAGINEEDIDPSTLPEGATYEGLVDVTDDAPVTYGIDGEMTQKKAVKVSYDFFKIGDDNANITLDGELEFASEGSFKYYLDIFHKDEAYVELKIDYWVELGLHLTGGGSGEMPLVKIPLRFLAVLEVAFTPKLILEMEADINVIGTLKGTVGVRADTVNGITNISSMPKFDSEIKGEVKFFIGIAFEPAINFIHEDILTLKLTVKLGVEVKGEIVYESTDTNENIKHTCGAACVDGEFYGKFAIEASVKFFNYDKWEFENTPLETKIKLFDFYYSLALNEFGIGDCPNKSYKTRIIVNDNTLNKVNDAVITVDGNVISRDSYEAYVYLKKGTHTFKAESPNYRTSNKDAEIKAVSTKPNELMIIMYEKDYSGSGEISNSGQTYDPSIDIGAYITENGDLYKWGNNAYGLIGDGTKTDKNTPVKIMSNVINIAYSNQACACVTTSGDLYTWGNYWYGQLGDDTTTIRRSPQKIMSNVAQVYGGLYNFACITKDGDLYTWGYNGHGQLGDGTTTDRYTPTKIMENVAQVSLGFYHSACITKSGDLYTWGDNYYGQLGDDTETSRYTPVKIMSNVAQICLKRNQSSCITTNNVLYMWGENSCGQLGDGTNENRNSPVETMSNVAQVNLDQLYSACITTTGDLYTWGYNGHGQLGNGTTTEGYTPIKVMSKIAKVSLGGLHSACITTTGDLYAWGYNFSGQLGDGTTTDRTAPTKIMSNVAEVSLGGSNSACITTDGIIYTWGSNGNGQLGDGTTTDRYTPTKITIPSIATLELLTEKESESPVREFTGLLPNEVYNIYSMNSRKADEPFSSDNLLYIDQKISDSEGNLTVEINTEKTGINPEIFVKAMNGGVINNAEISSLSYTKNSASVGWEAVEGADKYTVYSIRNGIFFKEADTSGLSYTVDGLIPGTEYGFIIQAWVNGEYSVLDKSDAVYFIPKKELSIEDYIKIVNSIPDDEDSVILTDEQIEAIEKVLEYDYAK